MRTSTPMHKPRVLFIREWEQQLTASGCCGRLEGDLLATGTDGGRVFAERRCTMEALGTLYRHVQERYGEAVEHESSTRATSLPWPGACSRTSGDTGSAFPMRHAPSPASPRRA